MWDFFTSTTTKQIHFIQAIIDDNYDKVEEMLNKGMKVNFTLTQEQMPSVENASPLYLAMFGNKPKIVAKLLQAGARIPARDATTKEDFFYNNLSPLHWAISTGERGLIQPLINQGAQVNILEHVINDSTHELTTSQISPLCYAILQGRDDMVDILLANGADVNYCGAFKNEDSLLAAPPKPLHCAIFMGRGDIVVTLCAVGANVNARFIYRKTGSWTSSLQLANENNLDIHGIANFLRMSGAQLQVGPVEVSTSDFLRAWEGKMLQEKPYTDEEAGIGAPPPPAGALPNYYRGRDANLREGTPESPDEKDVQSGKRKRSEV